MNKATLVGVSLLFFYFPAYSQGLDFQSSELFGDSSVAATLTLIEAVPKEGRCEVSTQLFASDLWSNLDAIARAQDNMGSTRNRLYWVGPTRLRSVDSGGLVQLTSRARYESWTYVEVIFDTIKTKNFQDTKTVDFYLHPIWNPDENALVLKYEIQNIKNVPGEIEQAAKKLGAKFGEEIVVSLPQDTMFEKFDPKIVSGPTFSESEGRGGLIVSATISILMPRVQCWIVQGTVRNPEFSKPLILQIIDSLGE